MAKNAKAKTKTLYDKRRTEKERIGRDFLLQFTFTIILSILLTIVYNSFTVIYSNAIFTFISVGVWVMMYAGIAVAIGGFVGYAMNKRKLWRTVGIYALATAAFFGWITAFQRLMVVAYSAIPAVAPLRNTLMLMQIEYVLLGIAVVVQVVVYIVRIRMAGRASVATNP